MDNRKSFKCLHVSRKKVLDSAMHCRDQVEDFFEKFPNTKVLSLFGVADRFGPVLAVLVMEKVSRQDYKDEMVERCYRWVATQVEAQHPEVLAGFRGGDQQVLDLLMRDQEKSHVAMALSYVSMAREPGCRRPLGYCARALAELQVAHDVFGFDVFRWSTSVARKRALLQLFK